jgi:NAD(P)-dependent dehydrogenase (short-subunit alcohol dehydrogenase family)/predicted GNAT family N-acyltransferase
MKLAAGQVAVITGAASGFGLEFARRAASLGMRVVMADIESAALEAAASSIRASGASVVACRTDVSKPDDIEALACAAYDEWGSVHLLFNNAGVAPVGLLWEHDPADWQWVLGVNVLGVANGIRSFVPRMLKHNTQAHIVNTASVAGYLSPTTMGLYNVSKHAVVTLSETLHHDLRSVGASIGVTVLSPAFVPTGIAQSERNRPADQVGAAPPSQATLRARASMERAVSAGRLSAAEVAELTFQAIEKDRFYLFTHPAILASIRARHLAITEGQGPDDPFAKRPGLSPIRTVKPASVVLELGHWSTMRKHAQPVRFQVFVDEQGIDPALELDTLDAECVHCVAWIDGVVAGTGRLLPDGHIGRMAVLAAFRRSGVGGLILERLVSEARSRGHQRVELSAQAYVETFYRRHGFSREGAIYQEAGIDHVRMWRDL